MSTAVAGTVREALMAASDALAAAGVETPRLDAEVLLAEATGMSRAELQANGDEGVSAVAARSFGGMVRRRVRREPVAYILGRKGFRRIELEVDPGVLIPRPETELLVEVAVELEPRTVLDVGTGSGAIALAVADELQSVRGTGVDVSPDAIEVAQANAARLGLANRVNFRLVSQNLPPWEEKRHAGREWDLVVANLPYVTEDEWPTLAPEITQYEPREALVGGADGLDPIRNLLASLPDCDSLALECGRGQAETVEQLVTDAGFPSTERRPDLAGIERVVLGRR
jgi:release factor glutamine methyltransferase